VAVTCVLGAWVAETRNEVHGHDAIEG
jgi:hypothetical protein